jgi:hypothetical protein
MWRLEAVIDRHFKSVKRVTCSSTTSYPTKVNLATSAAHSDNDNNATVISSNRSCNEHHDAHHALGKLVGPSLAIADTGTTSFFLTKGAPCQNKQKAVNPITVKLPDGRNIKSTQHHAWHDNSITFWHSHSMQSGIQSPFWWRQVSSYLQ